MEKQVKRNVGRPAMPDIDKAKSRSFRLTHAQYAKLQSLGGAKFLKSLLDGY